MKILFISTFLGKKLGGAEISSEFLFNEMSKKNNIIYLTLSKYEKKNIISCNLWFIPKHVFLIGNHVLDFILYKLISYKIKKYNFDLIHVQDLFVLPAAIWVGEKNKIPVVCTIRDSLPRKFGKLSFLFFKRNKVYTNFLNKCSKIIAISNSIKEDLINVNVPEDKIEVIYNISSDLNIEIDVKTQSQNPSNIFNILSLGRLHKEKGFDVLIDAINILVNKDKIKNIFVTIIGEGVEKDNLNQKIKKMNLSKNIIIKPWIENKHLSLEYKKTDIVVVPSVFKEPLGRVAIESIAHGVPVIASNMGGLKEIVKNGINGFLFENNNSEELANRILEIFKNKSLLADMKVNTQKHSEVFDKNFICKKTQNLYENLN